VAGENGVGMEAISYPGTAPALGGPVLGTSTTQAGKPGKRGATKAVGRTGSVRQTACNDGGKVSPPPGNNWIKLVEI
jgi:hypothetical protein